MLNIITRFGIQSTRINIASTNACFPLVQHQARFLMNSSQRLEQPLLSPLVMHNNLFSSRLYPIQSSNRQFSSSRVALQESPSLLARNSRSRKRIEMLLGLICCGLGFLYIQHYLLQKDVIRKPAFKRALRLISKNLGEPITSTTITGFTSFRDRYQEKIEFKFETPSSTADATCLISTRDLNRILNLSINIVSSTNGAQSAVILDVNNDQKLIPNPE